MSSEDSANAKPQTHKKNVIVDMQQKLMLFSSMDGAIRKLKTPQLYSKNEALNKVLNACRMYQVELINDGFKTEWNAFTSYVEPKVTELLQQVQQEEQERSKESSTHVSIETIERALQIANRL